MRFTRCQFMGGIFAAGVLGTLTAQVPNTLLHSIPAPPVGVQFGAQLGSSVAVDGCFVAVGAPSDDTGGTDFGAVKVFDSRTGSLVFLLPSPARTVNFGSAVAISGTRVVVGAYHDNTGAWAAGSAYVYDLTSGTPAVPVAALHNPSPAADDWFGSSVAISGTRVVVGAKYDDTGGSDAGRAYVYDIGSVSPAVPVAMLNNPSPALDDRFGYAVAISGSQVVVGVPYDDTGASDAGSAYVYDINSVTPTLPVTTLKNPSPGLRDNFGYTVAISSRRVVVGAPYDDTGAQGAGSAYVYDIGGGTPTVPVATLNNPSSAAGDYFGLSVAIDGTTVAIGTPYDDTVVADKGGVYIYGRHPLDQDSDGLLGSWELTYWPTTAGHGAADDFDYDGYSELLELAFGLNPTLPEAGGRPLVTDKAGFLTMTISKQPGVTYEGQSAGTLRAGQPNSFSSATTTVLIDTATTLKVRDTVLIGSTPARFMRVKVTAAP